MNDAVLFLIVLGLGFFGALLYCLRLAFRRCAECTHPEYVHCEDEASIEYCSSCEYHAFPGSEHPFTHIRWDQ